MLLLLQQAILLLLQIWRTIHLRFLASPQAELPVWHQREQQVRVALQLVGTVCS